jgi:DNA-binding NarL/FixJ family response regulator
MAMVTERAFTRGSSFGEEADSVVRVLIVDDHQVVREGLRRILESAESIVIVGEACNGEEAVSQAVILEPDVITMDVKMPKMDGIAATREVKKLVPGAAVVMLTLFSDEYVKDSIEAGASGFVLKDSPSAAIIDAIHQANEGHYPLSPSLAKEMMSQYAQLLRNNRANTLTERQRDILRMIGEGLNSKEIAARLFIGPSTAKREIRQIMQRLEVNDRAQAVSVAIKQRII